MVALRPCTLATSASTAPATDQVSDSELSPNNSNNANTNRSTSTYGYSPQDGGQTHFGSETVDRETKHKRVAEVFHSVADSYDLMNDLMSGSMHRLWKDSFIQQLGPASFFAAPDAATCGSNVCFLDVAGGTGDIAFRICDALAGASGAAPVQSARVIVSDINASMLGVGRDRWESRQTPSSGNGGGGVDVDVEFLEASAESLPLPDQCVDSYTISFGIRNVTNIDIALAEAFRVLKPGGRFMCLEFSKVNVPGFREFYDVYSDNVIPVSCQVPFVLLVNWCDYLLLQVFIPLLLVLPTVLLLCYANAIAFGSAAAIGQSPFEFLSSQAMGEKVTGDRDSYQYLVESIRNFPPQPDFAAMIEDAGFSEVSFDNMTGGVVCVHSGFKLPEHLRT